MLVVVIVGKYIKRVGEKFVREKNVFYKEMNYEIYTRNNFIMVISHS